jgi:hypothetical protein
MIFKTRSQELPGDLRSHGAEVIAVFDATVRFEHVTDGQVGGGLAVGDRTTLQPQPALRVVGVEALVDQARFAYPRLTHQGNHLPVALPRSPEALAQDIQDQRAHLCRNIRFCITFCHTKGYTVRKQRTKSRIFLLRGSFEL